MEKSCTKCGLTKPIDQFNKRSDRPGSFASHCKTCQAQWREANREALLEQKKLYYEKNLEAIREKKRLYRESNLERDRQRSQRWYAANSEKVSEDGLRKRYGIDKAEYDAMLLAQSGVCAICRSECSTGKRLGVDHNHETGEVRGLLCTNCNMGIGKLKEDPRLLLSAINYLMADRTRAER